MTIPAVMSGVYLTHHGGPEALDYRTDIPVPLPGDGQVLVRVAAAGVNNTDINTRLGWYARSVTGETSEDETGDDGGWSGALAFPRIQGADLCGHVVAVGSGVTQFALGARVTCPTNIPRPTAENPMGIYVIGSEFDGAFAQYCLMEADDLYDVSASPLTDIEIAAMPCAYGTAEGLLERAGVVKGQKVLVTGASGGVGLAAVQLANLRGALVTGVCAVSKSETLLASGATAVLTRDDQPPAQSFDVVIDLVAGDGWMDLIRALCPGGHYAVAGAIAGPIVEADMRDIYLNDLTIHGCTYQSPAVFSRLVDLINEGAVRPVVAATYPLSDIGQAQEDFMSKRHAGKLVLIPQEDTP